MLYIQAVAKQTCMVRLLACVFGRLTRQERNRAVILAPLFCHAQPQIVKNRHVSTRVYTEVTKREHAVSATKIH